MSSILENSEADILARVISSHDPEFTRQFAQTLLGMGFLKDDQDRMHTLSQKAQRGELTAQEQYEIDNYERVGNLLSLLQSQARHFLNGCKAADE